ARMGPPPDAWKMLRSLPPYAPSTPSDPAISPGEPYEPQMDQFPHPRRGLLASGALRFPAGHLRARDGPRRLLRPRFAPASQASADWLGRLGRPAAPACLQLQPH